MPHQATKMEWGEEPEFFGPRDFFRNSLLVGEVLKRKKIGKLLDFGCGSGNLLLRLAAKGFDCTGMDASELAIKFLNQKISAKNLSNVKLELGTDETLINKPDRYDVIVSGETIEHIENDSRLAKSFFNLLNQDGICVISTPAHQSLWDINDDFSSHFRRYETEELNQKFIDAGFTIETSYYWGYPLALFWHRQVYNRLISKKINNQVNYSKKSLFSSLSKNTKFTQLLSLPFNFDTLFNWTKRGGGIILVARKR